MKKLTVLVFMLAFFFIGCDSSQVFSNTKALSNIQNSNSTTTSTKYEREIALYQKALDNDNISDTTKKTIKLNLRMFKLQGEEDKTLTSEEITALKQRKEELQRNRKRTNDADEKFLIDLNISLLDVRLE